MKRISIEIMASAFVASLSASCTGSNAGLLPSRANCNVKGPGTTNCGAEKESCCTSPEVTGGTYNRTYMNDGTVTGLADPATISSFNLDKYLVTVGRFRQFVAAWRSGWTPAAGTGIHSHLNGGKGLADSATPGAYETGWVTSDNANVLVADTDLGGQPDSTWTSEAGTQENLPINAVSWYAAYAFCIWDGGFLPSEAEWEYAAAGGSQQREYPWGTMDPGSGNQYAIFGCNYPNGTAMCAMTAADLAPVGTATLGAGLWGQLDLVGEVAEWCMDWTNADDTYVDPCTDCAYLTAPNPYSHRVIRGGGFDVGAASLVPRDDADPTNNNVYEGVRCARAP
jgi:formylglycine-generating enzyme required for sulfatase activity